MQCGNKLFSIINQSSTDGFPSHLPPIHLHFIKHGVVFRWSLASSSLMIFHTHLSMEFSAMLRWRSVTIATMLPTSQHVSRRTSLSTVNKVTACHKSTFCLSLLLHKRALLVWQEPGSDLSESPITGLMQLTSLVQWLNQKLRALLQGVRTLGQTQASPGASGVILMLLGWEEWGLLFELVTSGGFFHWHH